MVGLTSQKRLVLFMATSLCGVFRSLLVPFVGFPYFSSLDFLFHESRQQSLLYLTTIKTFNRKLEFLHIPKTAGSTVEELIAAGQANLSWGMCRFPTRPNKCNATVPNWFIETKTYDNGENPSLPWIGTPSLWHVLPHLFRPPDNPYDKVDVFTVIRDPLDRALSEYFYQSVLLQQTGLLEMGPTKFFEYKLMNASNSGTVGKYIIDDGHFVAQHEFIVRPLQVRQVDFVLSLSEESIGNNFDRTVHAFGLTMHWPGSETRVFQVDRSKHKVEPLQRQIVRRLKAFYAMDYELLFPVKQARWNASSDMS